MSTERFSDKLRVRAMNAAIAGALAVPSVLLVEGIVEESQCAQPNPSDIHAVETLLAEPPDESLYGLYPERPKDAEAITDLYDVTFLKPGKPQNASAEQQQAHIFAETQAYTEQYGIELVIDHSNPEEVPTPEQLASEEASFTLSWIQRDLAGTPKEYFEAAGLKRIALYAEKPSTKPKEKDHLTTGFVVPEKNDGTAHIDIAHNNKAFMHEVAHLLDQATCGDKEMWHDPAYTTYNGEDIYGPAKPQRSKLETEEAHHKTWHKRLIDTRMKNHEIMSLEEATCILDTAMADRQAKIIVASEYSLRGVVEDKAELGKELSNPNTYGEIFDPDKPLSKKAILLMSRLYNKARDVVKYFMATSIRPPKCER